jgi:hypothetical protein
MARICFHAMIITGIGQKVNLKHYFYWVRGHAISARHTTAGAIEKAHAGVGLIRNRRE